MNDLANPSRITFAVHPVARATERRATISLPAPVRSLIGFQVEAYSSDEANFIRKVEIHPLIAAADFAANHRQPLALSPDIIWAAILQGAAPHIINHTERLRPLFVRHERKPKNKKLRSQFADRSRPRPVEVDRLQI